jgi:hypothetical protein
MSNKIFIYCTNTLPKLHMVGVSRKRDRGIIWWSRRGPLRVGIILSMGGIHRLRQRGRKGLEMIIVCVCVWGERRGQGKCRGRERRGWERGGGLCLGDRPFSCCACSSIGGGRARIGLRAFARLLSSSIRVVVGGALTVRLADVLGCKRAVDFTFPAALVTALYPHSRGRLRPRPLIGTDVFFFWEVGTSWPISASKHVSFLTIFWLRPKDGS